MKVFTCINLEKAEKKIIEQGIQPYHLIEGKYPQEFLTKAIQRILDGSNTTITSAQDALHIFYTILYRLQEENTLEKTKKYLLKDSKQATENSVKLGTISLVLNPENLFQTITQARQRQEYNVKEAISLLERIVSILKALETMQETAKVFSKEMGIKE